MHEHDDDRSSSAAAMQAAMKATEAILESDPSRSISDPSLPVYQVAAIDALEREREQFIAGDKMALLGAIRICANHDVVMPEWVAKAYISAYDNVLRARLGSWDDAFGRPFKGKWQERRRALRDMAILYKLDKAVAAGKKITHAMAEIARDHHVDVKTVQNLRYKPGRTKKSSS